MRLESIHILVDGLLSQSSLLKSLNIRKGVLFAKLVIYSGRRARSSGLSHDAAVVGHELAEDVYGEECAE